MGYHHRKECGRLCTLVVPRSSFRVLASERFGRGSTPRTIRGGVTRFSRHRHRWRGMIVCKTLIKLSQGLKYIPGSSLKHHWEGIQSAKTSHKESYLDCIWLHSFSGLGFLGLPQKGISVHESDTLVSRPSAPSAVHLLRGSMECRMATYHLSAWATLVLGRTLFESVVEECSSPVLLYVSKWFEREASRQQSSTSNESDMQR